MKSVLSILLLSLTLLSTQAFAHNGQDHGQALTAFDSNKYLGPASLKLLKSPISYSEGYGVSNFISNPTTEDEKLINFGFACLNVFHYADAFRAFYTSYNQKPSAFAIVGLVVAAVHNDSVAGGNIAQEYLDHASEMQNLSEKEKAWLAFAKSYLQKGSIQEKIDILQLLQTVDSNNPESYSFAAWVLQDINVDTFKKALTLLANNTGAHHYLLHTYEMLNDAKNALAEAKVVIKLAPQSAHIQHMYGHVLPQRGQWKEALDQFLIADKIHLDWAKKNQVPPEEDWHYSHNLDLMAATYLGLGNKEKAKELWKQVSQWDQRAYLHYRALSVVTLKNQAEINQFVSELKQITQENPGWGQYLAPYAIEATLTKENVNTALQFYQGQVTKGKLNYALLAYVLIGSYATTAELNKALVDYFIGKMSSGGFDGWSNGYIEILRLKRIAEILQVNDVVNTLEQIEQKIQSGLITE